jgi:hypothetical protein
MSVSTQREEEVNHAHGCGLWNEEPFDLVLYLAANFMPLEFSRGEY